MSSLLDAIENRHVVTISPFYYLSVSNGVTWRINFVMNFIKNHTSKYREFIRGSGNIKCTSDCGVFRGCQNKYLYLLDPFTVLQIFKFRKNRQCILYCHTIWTGFYGIFFKLFFNVKFIFDDHNVEFDRFLSYKKFLIAILIFPIEFALVHLSEITVVSSYVDKKRISNLYKAKRIHVLENNFISFRQHLSSEERCKILDSLSISSHKKIILFFGNFDYYPNIEALNFIENKIAPFLDANIFSIVIAGNGSNLLKKKSNIVNYVGFVENLNHLLLSVDLVIAPIFSGAGVKIKVLQTLSVNKPLIATREAMRGINFLGKNVVVTDDLNFLNQIEIFFH